MRTTKKNTEYKEHKSTSLHDYSYLPLIINLLAIISNGSNLFIIPDEHQQYGKSIEQNFISERQAGKLS